MSRESGPDLIAARTDARSDGGDEIFRIRSKPRCEIPDGDHGCACSGALPARVNGRNCAGSTVGQENGHAVGGAYAHRHGRIIGDGDICFGPIVGRTREFLLCFEHIGAVHLTHAHERVELDIESIRKVLPACGLVRANPFQFQLTRAEAMT